MTSSNLFSRMLRLMYPARNIYIFMGHSPDLFGNPAYTTLFRNAIFWAAEK